MRASVKPLACLQSGFALLWIILIMAGVATLFATKSMERANSVKTGIVEESSVRRKQIELAINTFVANNKRLPCPADGALDKSNANRGKENRDVATGDCNVVNAIASNQQSGIVPWNTLGLTEATVQNYYGDYLSFRVYSGATGLSRDGGADMTHCDTSNAPNSDATMGVNGLCNDTAGDPAYHNHSSAQFLNGKGLTVKTVSGDATGIAYVIIDHGQNGAGAFQSSGLRKPLPAVNQISEKANTEGENGSKFEAVTKNTSVPTSDATYFDDIVEYKSIETLAKDSGLSPRDWPDSPPLATFDSTTTANLTSSGSNHFLTQENLGNINKTMQSQTIGGNAGVAFGNDVSNTGNYSACLWWPGKIPLYINSSSPKKALLIYLEASLASTSAGFTVGILPSKISDNIDFSVSNSTCGETTSGSRLGWQEGNLPSPRFAVEVDTHYDANRDDPDNENHMAIDFDGVEHDGASAATCPPNLGYHTTLGQKDCYTSNDSNWLENGLGSFHKIRVEVEVRSQTCSGNAPLMKAWLIPHSACAPGTEIECTNIQDISKRYLPSAIPAGSISLERCIPTPSPTNAFDSVYFGLTSSARGGSGPGFKVYFQKLSANTITIP